MCVHVHKHAIECHFDYQFFQSIQQRYQLENTEPKFIVFLTQLLALFKFCPSCKSNDVLVDVLQNGTMAQVKVTKGSM